MIGESQKGRGSGQVSSGDFLINTVQTVSFNRHHEPVLQLLLVVPCFPVNPFPQQVLDLPELLELQLFLVDPEKESPGFSLDHIEVADEVSGESSQQVQVVHVNRALLGLLAHPRYLAVLQYQLVPEVHQVPDRETRRRITESNYNGSCS